MNKIIKYGDEAKNDIVTGINTVADIVKTTVGPKGRNVLIREQLNPPIITNDGVTIAKSIELKDNAQNAGAALMISAANKTNDVAGDGTTTTTILTQSLINNYYKLEKQATDHNVVLVQNEMKEATNKVSDYLLKVATPANDIDSIRRVASISSGSEKTGQLIADAFELAGEYGSVIVEDSKISEDYLEPIQGMKFDSGMVTSYLFSDRVNRKTDWKDVYVLIVKDKIDNAVELFPILDMCNEKGIQLLIMCEDMGIEPLNMILTNKARGALLNVAVIRLPGFGTLREDLTNDIALATGATIISRDAGLTIKDLHKNELGLFEELGKCDEISITMDDTVIKFSDTGVQGESLSEVRKQLVAELEGQLNVLPEEEKEQCKRRISNLTSGIAIIKVSGNSDVEIKDKKLRIEDAINSVQAAKEEGIVPGGGYSFLMAYMNEELNLDSTVGGTIVKNSLLATTEQIAENCGRVGSEVVNSCLELKQGYNALTDKFEDLLQTGVINSVKVDRYSLINATSVASTVITMGGLIVQENEKDQNILQLQAPIPGIM